MNILLSEYGGLSDSERLFILLVMRGVRPIKESIVYKYILILHVLAATVWTGGHLVLAVAILPGALKNKSSRSLMEFEFSFEKVGIPALIIQVATGLWLAYNIMPSVSSWLAFDNPISRLILSKLGYIPS